MKRSISMLLAVMLIFSLAACSANEQNTSTPPNTNANQESTVTSSDDSEPENTASTGSNVLIAYFSVPEDVDTDGVDAVAGASIVVKDGEKLGNTEYVARLIQETVGGDLFRIETVEPYSLDHDPLVDQAADEQDADLRPELATHVEDFEKYEYVFLGFPNWWGDMPMALYSFFEEYDFSGKTIIPFNVHNGSRFSSTISTIQDLEPDATVIEDGFTVSESNVAKAEPDVIDWLNGLGY